MDTIRQDIRFGARLLLKSPTFTLVAMMTLALGIGASTAIFSVVNSIWLQPMRFPHEERLVMVWDSLPKAGVERSETSLATLEDWTAQAGVFEHVAGIVPRSLNMGGALEPERLQAFRVGAALFPALEARPSLGRAFSAEEDRVGGEAVVVLSDALWRRRFGGAPSVLGESVTLDGEPYTVVGVMPKSFDFPPGAEAWVPLAPTQAELDARGDRKVRVVGRLKPGFSVSMAEDALRVLAGQLAERYPDTDSERTVRLTSVREAYLGPLRPLLITLAGAVGFVLLIGCANVASLLLARAAARRRELAIRGALGASPTRLMVQALTESVLLSLLGGGLGILGALWGTHMIATMLPPGLAERLPGWQSIQVDGGALLFCVGLSAITGVLFGLAPAFQMSRQNPLEAMREGAGATAGRKRIRSALVTAEVALALMLVVGASLMLRSLYQLQGTSPGFAAERVFYFDVTLPETKYPTDAERVRFFHALQERLSSMPGAQAVSAASLPPISRRSQSSNIYPDGQPKPLPGQLPEASQRVISPGYFRTMGIPLHEGRDFNALDVEDSPRVAMINSALARRFWPGESPLGKRFFTGGTEPWEVIGVVGDVRTLWRGQVRSSVPEFYLPLAQAPRDAMVMMVTVGGTGAAASSLALSVREGMASLDPEQPPPSPRPLEELIAESFGSRHLLAALLGFFACVALLLAAGGVYGIMAYSVTQRRTEIGVRMALGAREGSIFWLILSQALRLAGLGVIIGSVLALVLARGLSKLLFEVSPADPLVFLGTACVLLFVALVAGYVPAWRAARVPPSMAMREE
ncbi:ABC transporter permease [Myxococcus sp. AB036A]|uniref:ABC transporter permease n=1 Tax=Myxococcus sp. AB036A TaxID=2562793 RepID=UPI00114698BB|nr:ABC transporter permease [Myxococcus sp. AB036A]